MRILLTGARGFTGRHFAAQAETAGHMVVPLGADLTDASAVQDEAQAAAADAVVHLAAISFVGHADASAFYAVNLMGTLNLLDALAALPRAPRQVLLASSANVYGNADASPIRESQPPAPVNHYAMSKLAMEHLSRTYADRLPIVLARPFNYTGTGQAPNFLIPKLVDHFARRAPEISLGNLHVEREFNDVRMVCAAYLRLLDSGVAGQTYNVCSGQPYTLGAVLEMLRDLTRHTLEVKQNPAFVRANEVHRLCGDPSSLLQATGPLPPYPLQDTLAWMLDSHPTAPR
jgi:nucleoside-diphosphate-sugar epimerase